MSSVTRRFRVIDGDVQEVEAPAPAIHGPGGWPMVSMGAGCPRPNVPKFRKELQDLGVKGVEVLPTGDLRIESRQARAEMLRKRGMIDQDGGYRETY